MYPLTRKFHFLLHQTKILPCLNIKHVVQSVKGTELITIAIKTSTRDIIPVNTNKQKNFYKKTLTFSFTLSAFLSLKSSTKEKKTTIIISHSTS